MTRRDFMLAAYHARWENGNTSAIKNEVRHVPRVFEAMRQARPGERDLIIGGAEFAHSSSREWLAGRG
jgi:aconitase A